MSERDELAQGSRLATLLRCVIYATNIATILLGLWQTTWRLPGTYARLPTRPVVVLAVLILAAGESRWMRQIERLLPLVVGSSALCVLVALGSLEVGFPTWEWRVGEATRTVSPQGDWFEPYSGPDPVLGLKGLPGVSAREHHRDFDVVYHTDDEGWRVTPVPQGVGPHPEIWFLGCSFTWGIGVTDEQAFPAILAGEAWPTHRVRNFSCPGWGTVQAAVALDARLKQGDKPRAVFYSYMLHARRNYLRRSWRALVNSRFPWYELHNGKLIYHGLRDATLATRDDGPELDRDERELTVALITSMQHSCRERGIPFVVLAFQDVDGVPQAVARQTDVPVLPLVHVWPDYYPNDGHPAAEWHRLVAYALASSPAVAQHVNCPELYRPQAVSLSSIDLSRLHLWVAHGDRNSSPDAAKVSVKDGLLRVEAIRCPSHEPWRVQLVRWHHRLAGGGRYQLSFEARADKPRPLDVCLLDEWCREPKTYLYSTVKVGDKWQAFRFDLECPAETGTAGMAFRLGAEKIPVELRSVVLSDAQGQRISPIPWRISNTEEATDSPDFYSPPAH